MLLSCLATGARRLMLSGRRWSTSVHRQLPRRVEAKAKCLLGGMSGTPSARTPSARIPSARISSACVSSVHQPRWKSNGLPDFGANPVRQTRYDGRSLSFPGSVTTGYTGGRHWGTAPPALYSQNSYPRRLHPPSEAAPDDAHTMMPTTMMPIL